MVHIVALSFVNSSLFQLNKMGNSNSVKVSNFMKSLSCVKANKEEEKPQKQADKDTEDLKVESNDEPTKPAEQKDAPEVVKEKTSKADTSSQEINEVKEELKKEDDNDLDKANDKEELSIKVEEVASNDARPVTQSNDGENQANRIDENSNESGITNDCLEPVITMETVQPLGGPDGEGISDGKTEPGSGW